MKKPAFPTAASTPANDPATAAYIREFEAMATRAAEFMDADAKPGKWRPSTLLRVGFYTLLTGPNPAQSAAFANDMLGEARRRFRAGLPCNPFEDLTI